MIELASGAVHVWRLARGPRPSYGTPHVRSARPDERERANRFRFERDAVCFVLTRAHLGGYWRVRWVSPQPRSSSAMRRLANRVWRAKAVRCSTSHTRGLALLAIAAGRRVGVDVERIRPMPGRDLGLYLSETKCAISKRFRNQNGSERFSAADPQRSVSEGPRDGLGFGLQGFRSRSIPNGRPACSTWMGSRKHAALGSADLALDPAYSASLVAEAPITSLFCRDIDESR